MTARGVPPAPPTSKSFQNVCPIFCPNLGGYPRGHPLQLGGTPGGTPSSWGEVPPGGPPQLGGTPRGAPPVGGTPPQLGGLPPGAPPVGGGLTLGAPPPQLGGLPRGRPPQFEGYPRGRPPCEQTNWKHYLPVILRMRAVMTVSIHLINSISQLPSGEIKQK